MTRKEHTISSTPIAKKAAENFAVYLTGWRAKQRLTMQEVADLLGCSVSHIYNLESGNHMPSFAILAMLAHHMQFDFLVGMKRAAAKERIFEPS
jgi:transcriptional regulator with XRE-family HTH domain